MGSKMYGRAYVFFNYEFLLTRRIMGAIVIWKLSNDRKIKERIRKAFRYYFKGNSGN